MTRINAGIHPRPTERLIMTSDNSADSSVVRKIRKLLAIAGDDGASEAEIQTAMAHAQRLMGTYHVKEEDLAHEPADDYKKVDDAKFNRHRSFVGKTIFAWENYLASFVTQFVGCKAYTDKERQICRKNGFVQFDENDEPRYGASIVFYGVAEDAKLASDLYDELHELVATMALGRWGTIYRGDGASYAEGFVGGLSSQIKKAEQARLTQAESSTSLILAHRQQDLVRYKQDKASKWLEKETGIRPRRQGVAGSRRGSWAARGEGYVDGQNTEVSASRSKKLM